MNMHKTICVQPACNFESSVLLAQCISTASTDNQAEEMTVKFNSLKQQRYQCDPLYMPLPVFKMAKC